MRRILAQTALAVSMLFSATSASLIDSFKDLPQDNETEQDNDANKSIKQICKENGFAIQQHMVTTEDGYILTVFRIPGFLNETKPYQKKPVVLMQHGLEADAACWLIHTPEKAPAFNLASQGFDIWLGNNRGSMYGVQHKTLDPEDPTDKPLFWNFDFEEMGTFDLPAQIDYILDVTGQEKLSYIGHSEGTTQMFIGASLNQEYFKQKVNLFVALAPITRIGHVRSTLLKLIAMNIDYFQKVLIDDYGMYNMFPPSWIGNNLVAELCEHEGFLCKAFLELFADLDPSIDDLVRTRTYLTHFPSGSGYRNFLHYGQIINSDRFQRYDWGTEKNTQLYGTSIPPIYPLDQISNFPIALIGGTEDELGSMVDVDWTNEQLGSNVVYYGQYQLGHASFLIAKDMSFFQKDVIGLLKQYSTNTFAKEETTFLA